MSHSLPASIGQRLLWVLDQFRGEQGSANCPILLRLRGSLDEERLTGGLDALVARHESLRTTFSGRGSRLTQLVHPPRPVPLRRIDLSSAEDPELALRDAVTAEIGQRIDIGRWPTRVTLMRLGADDHALCLNMHHAVTDGGSCALVVRDLRSLTGKDAPPLPPVRWQYSGFCDWQREWLASAAMRDERAYWRRHLAGARLPAVPLRRVPADAARRSAVVTAEIGAEVVSALGKVAVRHRTTPAVVLLAAYYVALHRLTGDDDVAVASFLANRTMPDTRETVGLLANMAVLRTRLAGADGFPEVLRRTHDTAMGAFAHQRLPYQLLPADTLAEQGRRPDDVMFQLVPKSDRRQPIAGTMAEVVLVDQLGSRFECEFQLYPRGEALHVLLSFNCARLDPEWAAKLVAEYVSSAAEIASAAR